jgi:hypothetical protein
MRPYGEKAADKKGEWRFQISLREVWKRMGARFEVSQREVGGAWLGGSLEGGYREVGGRW